EKKLYNLNNTVILIAPTPFFPLPHKVGEGERIRSWRANFTLLHNALILICPFSQSLEEGVGDEG
ncbi:hypothetical protein, partial [Caldithrix abyssi]